MDNHRHQKPWNRNFNWRSIYFQCKYAVFHLKSLFKNPQVNKQCTTFFSCFEKNLCDLISGREYMAFFYLCDFYPVPLQTLCIHHSAHSGAWSSGVKDPSYKGPSRQLCFADGPWEIDVCWVVFGGWENGSYHCRITYVDPCSAIKGDWL